jgi:hypothetical protein
VLGSTLPNIPLRTLHPAGVVSCDQLASLDITLPLAPVAGVATWQVPIPDDPRLVGLTLFAQVLQLEVSGTTLVSISSSNGLRLVLGSS